eukprot:247601-Rhodomonas_salina.1
MISSMPGLYVSKTAICMPACPPINDSTAAINSSMGSKNGTHHARTTQLPQHVCGNLGGHVPWITCNASKAHCSAHSSPPRHPAPPPKFRFRTPEIRDKMKRCAAVAERGGAGTGVRGKESPGRRQQQQTLCGYRIGGSGSTRYAGTGIADSSNIPDSPQHIYSSIRYAGTGQRIGDRGASTRPTLSPYASAALPAASLRHTLAQYRSPRTAIR